MNLKLCINQYIMLILIILTTACTTSQPAPTDLPNTPTPQTTNNQSLIDKIIQYTEGVQSVPSAITNPIEGGGSQALITITTTPDHNNEDTAIIIYALALEETAVYDVPSPMYFSLIIDDGTTKTVYEHNRDTNQFDISTLQ
jgi:hypothetical protein